MIETNTPRRALRGGSSTFALALMLAGFAAGTARAQTANSGGTSINLNLGSVVASGATSGLADDATPNNPDSAAAKAPSRTPFNATQPTSLISRQFIANSVPMTGNYDDAIKFDPSVANVEPDGPGLQESKSIEIRGFQDGQYNILFDGIPLAGSPTDFHHQSAVYFTSNDLGSVEIDRGPGTASTIGDATFGGTLALYSKDPAPVMTGTVYGGYGSWQTAQAGGEFDTGAIRAANGASAILDVQHDSSNGYLTYSGDHRSNIYGKVLVPLNADTLLTFEAMHNVGFQYTPSGATPQQLAEYGPNFGNNNDPATQAYYAYQQNKYSTDFEYIGLATKLPYDIAFDNKAYTDAFYHQTYEATDPSGLTKNLTGTYYLDGSTVGTKLTNAVPGKAGFQDYRAWGDVARFVVPVLPNHVSLKTGIWYDHTVNSYSSYAVDMSAGGANYTKTAGASPFSYDLDDDADTIQPYAEFDITPLPGLTLIPGAKYSYFSRTDDALINKTTKGPADNTKSYSDIEPSFEVRYIPVQGLSLYAQAAKGFQAPPLNVFFAQNVDPVHAESTWNYQTGAIYQTKNTDISGDLYLIHFTNYIQSNAENIGGTSQTVYSNGGGVIYKGIEIEGTQNIYGPLSLYANYTLNSANYTNGGATVAQSPLRTYAVGAIFQKGPFYASLIGKVIGPQFGQDGSGSSSAPVDSYPIKTYSNVDFAAVYTMPLWNGDTLKLKLNANNLLNDTQAVQLAGLAGDNVTPMWFTNPGRSVFVSASLSFR